MVTATQLNHLIETHNLCLEVARDLDSGGFCVFGNAGWDVSLYAEAADGKEALALIEATAANQSAFKDALTPWNSDGSLRRTDHVAADKASDRIEADFARYVRRVTPAPQRGQDLSHLTF